MCGIAVTAGQAYYLARRDTVRLYGPGRAIGGVKRFKPR